MSLENPVFELTVGRHLPVLRVSARYKNGKPLPLPIGSTVVFRMWKEGQYNSPKISDELATIVQQNTGADETTETILEFGPWNISTHTDIEENYYARFICTNPSGKKIDVPSGKGRHIVVVVDQPD